MNDIIKDRTNRVLVAFGLYLLYELANKVIDSNYNFKATYDDKSIVVENNDINCRPCGKHGGHTCPKGHFKCMKDIEPERVLIAALSILQQG